MLNLLLFKIPARIFIGLQEPEIQRGTYSKSFFTFKRRWSPQSVVENSVSRTVINRERDLEAGHDHEDRRELSSLSSRLYRYIRNSILTTEDPTNHRLGPAREIMPPGFYAPQEAFENFSNDTLSGTDSDTFVKSVTLSLNGKVLQSLTIKDADLNFGSPESFFLFSKCTGTLSTGFSHGKPINYDFAKFWYFPSIFLHLKMIFLIALFDQKLPFFQKLPN